MKKDINTALVLIVLVVISLLQACSENITNKQASTDDTIKGSMLKMSAKERLLKNNILEVHTNLKDMHLLGRVKTLIEKNYRFLGDKRILEKTEVYSFDEHGNHVASHIYEISSDKTTETRDSITFDAKGNQLAFYSSKDRDKWKLMATTAYDSHGNQVAYTQYNDDERTIYSVDSYKYDNQDNLVEVNFGRLPYRADKKCFVQYDENGFVTFEEGFDTAGKLQSTLRSKSDERGDLLYAAVYDSQGSIEMRDSVKYDDSGHTLEDTYYDKYGRMRYKDVTRIDKKDRLLMITVFHYNTDGSIRDSSATLNAYEYDTVGNVTRKMIYEIKAGKKVPVEMEERSFTYY